MYAVHPVFAVLTRGIHVGGVVTPPPPPTFKLQPFVPQNQISPEGRAAEQTPLSEHRLSMGMVVAKRGRKIPLGTTETAPADNTCVYIV